MQSGYSNYYSVGNDNKRNVEDTTESVTEDSRVGLTEEELKLAMEYKEESEYQKFLTDAFINKKYTREEINAVIGARKASGKTSTSANMAAAYGVILLDKDTRVPVSVSASMRRFEERVERPQYNIPRGNVQVDEANNTINFARGGRIDISLGYIYIAENHVSAFTHDQEFKNGSTVENWQTDYTEEGYTGIVNALIEASEKNNDRFTKSFSEKTLKFLEGVMGMDITKDININGTTFEVVDGQMQTKGYVYSKEDVTPDGIKYLQSLLDKAYEQNLI